MSVGDIQAQRREALFAAAGLQEILVFGNARVLGTGTQAFPTFYHLLNVDTGNAVALGRLRRGEPARVISPSFFVIDDLKAGSAGDIEFAWAPWAKLGEEISRAVQNRGPIGFLGGGEMPTRLWDAVRTHIDPSRFVHLDPLAARLRLVPDAVQLADHRSAALMVDALFDRLPSMAGNGEPTWMLQRRLETEALLQGADQCSCWMTTAPTADFCRTAKATALRVPQAEDQLLLGVMLTVNGAWGHGIRSYHLGPPPAAVASLHCRIWEAQTDVAALLRPGARLTAANDEIERIYHRLFDDAVDAGRRFRTLHGLGFSYEEPASSPMFRQPFERTDLATPPPVEAAAGMLFEVHPNLFLPGVGGAAIGDMLLIGADKNEYLTQFPRALHVI